MSDFDATAARWLSFASDADAHFDDIVKINAGDIAPTVTWGISPDHGIAISETIPDPAKAATPLEKASIVEALEYMKLDAGTPIKGVKIDVAFIGSCTNGRISDFREVAKYIKGHKVAQGVQAIVVPGSQIVAIQCEQEGLPEIFREAGFEWRAAGCSMCLGDEPRQTRRRPTLRLVLEPQLQGPPRLTHRPHRPDVPRHGRRRRHQRPHLRRPRAFPH